MAEINIFLGGIILMILQIGLISIILAAVVLVLANIYFKFDRDRKSHNMKIEKYK